VASRFTSQAWSPGRSPFATSSYRKAHRARLAFHGGSDHGQRPKERFKVNSLQLVSPRDPELPAGGSAAVCCPREKTLIARLLERAGRAGSLPEIVPTSFPPPWSRLSIAEFDRQTLWRAGGAL